MYEGEARTPGRMIPGGLTEEDIASDFLLSVKLLGQLYGWAATEATHEGLYQTFSQQGQRVGNLQRQVWHHLYRRGWYTVHHATPEQIRTADRTAETYLRDIGQRPPSYGAGAWAGQPGIQESAGAARPREPVYASAYDRGPGAFPESRPYRDGEPHRF